MKTAILILGVLVVFCLCICMIKCLKHKNIMAKSICRMVIPAIATITFAIVALFVNVRSISLFVHSLYFAATDWLMFAVLSYVIIYVGEKVEAKIKLPLMYAMIIADNLFLLSNVFSEKIFTVDYISFTDSLSYYKVQMRPFYVIHACVIYSLVIFAIIALIYKLCNTGSVYRKKYISVLTIIGVTVAVNAVCLYLGDAIDFSVIGYAGGGLLMYYYSLVYMPGVLKQQTMSLVVDDMSEGLVILDENNECIYMNTHALELLEVDKDKLTLEGTMAEEWLDIHNIKSYQDAVINYKTRKGDGRYFKIYFNRIEDEKNYYIGSYFFIQDFTEENQRVAEAYYKATHNSLTGLYTAEYFYEMAEQRLNEQPDKEYIIVCSDIYNFKLVNDLIGWEYGNEILVHIAEAFRMRANPEDIYGYLGSDRFAVLMPKDKYDEAWFSAMAGDITYTKDDISYVLNIYFGVYEIKDKTIPVSVMCDRAYLILKTIKGSYTQRIAYYTDEVRDNVLRENELVGALDGAIDNKEFVIYLQPQISREGKLIGAEAVVRWKHPEKGLVNPGEFIPIFEKKNVISKIDVYIWHQACKQLRRWKEKGREDLSISVNISPKNLYTMDVYKVFTELTKKYDISPKNLRLEITETAIMTDLTKQNELIRKLRAAGFYVEMDDFGSGYSSLNMLKALTFDVIKIDKAFLEDSKNAKRSSYILESVIKLSKQLDMEIVVEGVETKEQVDFLKELGCDIFQGYYFDKPISVKEFEEKYFKE